MPRLAFLFAVPLVVGCTTTEDLGSIGALRLERCLDTVPADADRVGCATLEVPQIHADPSSPKIHLRAFASPAPIPRGREPLIFLTGGPGGSIGGFAARGWSVWLANALNRDVVFLEQRGNALSPPALDCKLDESDALAERLQQCVIDSETQGTWLQAFNTIESAHDIEDLRLAIGTEKLVLWGVSYGSDLAATFAREHPTSLAGLVLESSVLPDRPYRTFERNGLLHAKIDAFTAWVKEQCAANRTCAERYPGFDPGAELNTLLGRLKTTGTVRISDGIIIDSPETLDEFLFRAMYDVPTATLLLRAIAASNGDRLPELAANRVGDQPVLAYLEEALFIESRVASTTNLVVNCYDSIRAWTDEGLAAQLAGLSEELRGETSGEIAAMRATCSALPPPSVDQSRFTATVSSSAPTLFLGGQLDAVTPIEWAASDAARFPNAQLIASSCMGHGVFFKAPDCFGSILKTFSDHLGAPPSSSTPAVFDTSCIERRCASDALTEDLLLGNAR